MIEPSHRRFLLTRIDVAQAETHRVLGIIERQITARAERLTITDRAKRRHHGRGASSWTNADERLFQEHVAELTLARRGEIDALTRKLDRQEQAIAELRSRQRACVAWGAAAEAPDSSGYERHVPTLGGDEESSPV
jgi:hypothetical protein